MTRITPAALTFTLATMLASCMDTGPTAPRASGQVKVGLEETAHVRGLFVRFDRLVSDSRCPMGVMCIIAGEAVVELTVGDGRQAARFQLTLTGMEGDNESSAPPVTALGHRFQLFRLDPYPRINTPLILLPPPVATVIVD